MLGLMAAAWVVALVVGFRAVLAYEATPGKASARSAAWPQGTSLQLARRTPTLVMIAHPLCPCTRASLAELAKLMVLVDGRLTAYVIVGDSQLTGPTEKTATFQRAAAIPGVRAIADRDGTYRRLFGAATSGQVYLYDEDGQLRFSGGITAARGHEGPSRGRTEIASFVNDRRTAHLSSRVFGCLLKPAAQ